MAWPRPNTSLARPSVLVVLTWLMLAGVATSAFSDALHSHDIAVAVHGPADSEHDELDAPCLVCFGASGPGWMPFASVLLLTPADTLRLRPIAQHAVAFHHAASPCAPRAPPSLNA